MLFRAANSDVLVVETDGRMEQTAGIGTACLPIPWTLGLNCPDLELQMSSFKSPLFPTAPLPVCPQAGVVKSREKSRNQKKIPERKIPEIKKNPAARVLISRKNPVHSLRNFIFCINRCVRQVPLGFFSKA